MTEREGRRVLRKRFEAAGVQIAEDHRLEVAGHVIDLDGYDAAKKIGYEYITTEAGDREQITPEIVAALESQMEEGAFYLLLIDERDIADKSVLEGAADGFLGRLRALGRL